MLCRRTRPMTLCQRSRSHSEVKIKKICKFCLVHSFVKMLTIVDNCVDYNANVSKSKVKVTRDVKGQNIMIYTLSGLYCCIFMKLGKYVYYNKLCRCVAYKTMTMSKVKVTIRGQRSKCCNLYLVQAILTSQVIVSSLHLVS